MFEDLARQSQAQARETYSHGANRPRPRLEVPAQVPPQSAFAVTKGPVSPRAQVVPPKPVSPALTPVIIKDEERVLTVRERMQRFQGGDAAQASAVLKPESRRASPAAHSVKQVKSVPQKENEVVVKEEPESDKMREVLDVPVVAYESPPVSVASSQPESGLRTSTPSSERVDSEGPGSVRSEKSLVSSGRAEDDQVESVREEASSPPPPAPPPPAPSLVSSSSEGAEDIQPDQKMIASPARAQSSGTSAIFKAMSVRRGAMSSASSSAAASGPSAASSSYMGSAKSSAQHPVLPDTIESLQSQIGILEARIVAAQKIIDAGGRQKGPKIQEMMDDKRKLASVTERHAQLVAEKEAVERERDLRATRQKERSAEIRERGEQNKGSFLKDIESGAQGRRLRTVEKKKETKENAQARALKKKFDSLEVDPDDSNRALQKPRKSDRESDDWK